MSNIAKAKYSGLEIPLILAVISLFCWDSVILLPAKLLTVFFHELSHGIAAILTGGRIVEISINLRQGGVCYFEGGWFWLTATAGYLGSLLWGSGILLASLRRGMSRIITTTVGIIILVVAVLFMREAEALAISILSGAGLIYIGSKLKETYCDIFIKYISLISCFYVVFDIKDDLLDRTICSSDAYRISKAIFPGFMVPAGSYIIGIIWMGITIYILWRVFNHAFSHGKQ